MRADACSIDTTPHHTRIQEEIFMESVGAGEMEGWLEGWRRCLPLYTLSFSLALYLFSLSSHITPLKFHTRSMENDQYVGCAGSRHDTKKPKILTQDFFFFFLNICNAMGGMHTSFDGIASHPLTPFLCSSLHFRLGFVLICSLLLFFCFFLPLFLLCISFLFSQRFFFFFFFFSPLRFLFGTTKSVPHTVDMCGKKRNRQGKKVTTRGDDGERANKRTLLRKKRPYAYLIGRDGESSTTGSGESAERSITGPKMEEENERVGEGGMQPVVDRSSNPTFFFYFEIFFFLFAFFSILFSVMLYAYLYLNPNYNYFNFLCSVNEANRRRRFYIFHVSLLVLLPYVLSTCTLLLSSTQTYPFFPASTLYILNGGLHGSTGEGTWPSPVQTQKYFFSFPIIFLFRFFPPFSFCFSSPCHRSIPNFIFLHICVPRSLALLSLNRAATEKITAEEKNEKKKEKDWRGRTTSYILSHIGYQNLFSSAYIYICLFVVTLLPTMNYSDTPRNTHQVEKIYETEKEIRIPTPSSDPSSERTKKYISIDFRGFHPQAEKERTRKNKQQHKKSNITTKNTQPTHFRLFFFCLFSFSQYNHSSGKTHQIFFTYYTPPFSIYYIYLCSTFYFYFFVSETQKRRMKLHTRNNTGPEVLTMQLCMHTKQQQQQQQTNASGSFFSFSLNLSSCDKYEETRRQRERERCFQAALGRTKAARITQSTLLIFINVYLFISSQLGESETCQQEKKEKTKYRTGTMPKRTQVHFLCTGRAIVKTIRIRMMNDGEKKRRKVDEVLNHSAAPHPPTPHSLLQHAALLPIPSMRIS
eukprot:gene10966-7611_t